MILHLHYQYYPLQWRHTYTARRGIGPTQGGKEGQHRGGGKRANTGVNRSNTGGGNRDNTMEGGEKGKNRGKRDTNSLIRNSK